jgi:hypothetical protein
MKVKSAEFTANGDFKVKFSIAIAMEVSPDPKKSEKVAYKTANSIIHRFLKQESILQFLNLQLQRQRCSRLILFLKRARLPVAL